ncbi:hypothetical protein FHS19_001528 [Paenibacillus rhizosphaerae]|uniref:Uncharacterized protein n=1 Tax=Paenibacillus rhizosphaerae TaxID=297318 RepID=A0A839TJE3_9BACL|nr:hypothetical protein [Paenibacillus rhizosphaerae]MBB3126874.1 hypothetical protein [Paenibacillus rhizosphaerae]
MKIEIEVKAFGKENIEGTIDAFKSTELTRAYYLSEDKTLAEVITLLNKAFEEAESNGEESEHCLGKIVIRAKKEKGEIHFLG